VVYEEGGEVIWVASRKQRQELGHHVHGLCLLKPSDGDSPREHELAVFPDMDETLPKTKHEDFTLDEIEERVRKCHEILARHARLVIYCSGGMNRSPTIACALLMGKKGCSFATAKKALVAKRKSDCRWVTRIKKTSQELLGRILDPAAFADPQSWHDAASNNSPWALVATHNDAATELTTDADDTPPVGASAPRVDAGIGLSAHDAAAAAAPLAEPGALQIDTRTQTVKVEDEKSQTVNVKDQQSQPVKVKEEMILSAAPASEDSSPRKRWKK